MRITVEAGDLKVSFKGLGRSHKRIFRDCSKLMLGLAQELADGPEDEQRVPFGLQGSKDLANGDEIEVRE